LAAGCEAQWDGDRRTATCLSCIDGVDCGSAGASARAEGDRLRSKKAWKERAIKEAHPILGRVALAIDPLPDRGAAWMKGAVGEEKYGAALDGLSRSSEERVLVLHDRRIPRSKANIDHIAVTAAGVWVIDAKRYTGRVAKQGGGWLDPEVKLTVAGRDRTKLVAGVRKQIEHIAKAMAGSPFAGAPIHGALCFIEADWSLFAKPFVVDGVLVAWPKAIRQRLEGVSVEHGCDHRAMHRHLAMAFPPAVA
jgi:hypothetical protein